MSEQLLKSASEGDMGALDQLVRDMAPNIYAYLAGMLGDDRDAEDAMQETFVRVARAVGRYDHGADATAWVFAIARRVASDIRPTPAAPPGEVPPKDGNVSEWVHRSLRALPMELREVLVFREILSWDHDRIGAMLGLGAEDVTRRIVAAKTQLAEGMRGLT